MPSLTPTPSRSTWRPPPPRQLALTGARTPAACTAGTPAGSTICPASAGACDSGSLSFASCARGLTARAASWASRSRRTQNVAKADPAWVGPSPFVGPVAKDADSPFSQGFGLLSALTASNFTPVPRWELAEIQARPGVKFHALGDRYCPFATGSPIWTPYLNRRAVGRKQENNRPGQERTPPDPLAPRGVRDGRRAPGTKPAGISVGCGSPPRPELWRGRWCWKPT
jgi:hypothetical protein